MLAASSFFSHQFHMPSRPSPLSERSANAVPRPFSFTMANPASNEKQTLAPQRAFKPNPVVQTRDASTRRRRDMFFKRVQKDRDNKKWDARGEQIQRIDYLSDYKRWEAEKAREAPQLEDETIEDLPEYSTSSFTPSSAPQPEEETEEAEYIIAQEEHELQELVAAMEFEQDTASQHYGSDDEDYDQIFMECTYTIEPQQPQQQLAQVGGGFDNVDDMDMS